MIDFFQPTNPFAAQTQRLAAEAQQGGGDIFDIEALCRELAPGDAEAWQSAWLQLAKTVETRAAAAYDAGNNQTGMALSFNANQYYRQSEIFMGADDPRKRERFIKARENFRDGAKFQTPKIEVVEIACGDETYDGYFCHPHDPPPGPTPGPTPEKSPVVVLMGGADAYAEEIYFSGRQVCERGWGLLIVDTPGRGSSLYLKDIPARPEYEIPVGACFDYLVTRPDVDASHMALMGISMGGYYAARAAAYEDRIKALVCWGGVFSILDDLYEFFPPLKPTLTRVVGAKSDEDARKKLAKFDMAEAAPKITYPTLVTHGINDLLMNVEGARRLFEAIAAKDKTLKIWDGPEGGTGHCSYDNWSISIPFMLDWLAERI